MKNKVKKYVDDLFADIYDTRQLRELKEEISSNLLEKINDFISNGSSDDAAFTKAVASLGDMSELVEGLKKASETKFKQEMHKSQLIDKEHVMGYVIASAVLLVGLMVGGILYLKQQDLLLALEVLMPFILVSVPIYVYFGLTQETLHDYGMSKKRALTYSVATGVILLGITASGVVYLQGQKLFMVLLTFAPFFIGSAVAFIYLGLTEKSRSKMDSVWEKQWVEYYSNPNLAMVRGSISGVLWILTITAFFVGGFSWSWKYSWSAFVIATALEIVIEAVFTMYRKK